MTAGAGASFQVDEITAGGHTAVNISTLSASELSSIDVLYVVNPSNDNNGSEYLSNMSNIQAAVTNGMSLVLFDRYVSDADAILPGVGTMPSVRSPGPEIDIAASAPASFVNGIGGTLTDTTLDNGGSSAHGYVALSDLPAGATALLTTGNPSQITTFAYQLGQGTVFYSTIPLDFYSDQSDSAITPAEVATLATNAFAYVGGVGTPIYQDTDALFSAHGKLAFMASLAQAAYHLGIHEVTFPLVNDFKPLSDVEFTERGNELHWLATSDFPGIPLSDTGDEDFPFFGFASGVYTNENAGAVVGRTNDALFLSIRGTNDREGLAPFFPSTPDGAHWFGKEPHLDLFDPLMIAIRSYLAQNPEIDQLYVTGHSLGAAISDAITRELNANPPAGVAVENITFANPGYGIAQVDLDNATSFRIAGDTIVYGAAIADNDGDENLIRHNMSGQLSDLGSSNAALHSMNLYRQYTEFFDDENIDLQDLNGLYHGVYYNNIFANALVLNADTMEVNIGAQADKIFGSVGNDIILGGANNDTLSGGVGSDHIQGGSGSDSIYGDLGEDYLYGGDGADQLWGGDANDELWGGNLNDTLRGGGGTDILNGESGSDSLYGQAGRDFIYGGIGWDYLDGGGADDHLVGGEGRDTVYGRGGSDRIFGGNGNDTLYGGSNSDTIYGNNDHDELYGGAARDTLDGGAGEDTLDGGAAGDRMTGGAGRDTFVFNSMAETSSFQRTNGDAQFYLADTITDFQTSLDTIDLSEIDAMPGILNLSDQAFTFIGYAGNGGFSRGELGYYYDASNTIVHGSTDFDTWSDFAIVLEGTHTLTASHFIL